MLPMEPRSSCANDSVMLQSIAINSTTPPTKRLLVFVCAPAIAYIDFDSVFPGKGIPSFLGSRKRQKSDNKSTYSTITLLLERLFHGIKIL